MRLRQVQCACVDAVCSSPFSNNGFLIALQVKAKKSSIPSLLRLRNNSTSKSRNHFFSLILLSLVILRGHLSRGGCAHAPMSDGCRIFPRGFDLSSGVDRYLTHLNADVSRGDLTCCVLTPSAIGHITKPLCADCFIHLYIETPSEYCIYQYKTTPHTTTSSTCNCMIEKRNLLEQWPMLLREVILPDLVCKHI